MKSFRPKDGSGEPPASGGAGTARRIFTVRSAPTRRRLRRLIQKLGLSQGPGKEAKLCFMGHALMENRNGLVVDACLIDANGHAERIARCK
jgi:hypothetical protein